MEVDGSDDFPFRLGDLLGSMLIFRGVNQVNGMFWRQFVLHKWWVFTD